ncbi:MAG: hypothetical protein Q9192_003369 [Flavoplaca navasiana]
MSPATIVVKQSSGANALSPLTVDLGGSLAVASKGLFATGVSTDLNVGKTLAYTSIKFTNVKDELVARGSHTKYVALAWKDEKNIVEELSPKK